MSGSRSSSSGRSSSGTSGRKKSKRKIADIWLFLISFILYFAAVFIIWNFTKPAGTKVFAFCGGQIVKLLDSNNFTKDIITRDGEIYVFFHPTPDGKPLATSFKYFTFNGVFLAALILAVPKVKYKLRLKILLLGFFFLVPFQLLLFNVFVFDNYAKRMMWSSDKFVYSDFVRNSLLYGRRILMRIEGQLIPVLIWAGLFYYYRWHNILAKRMLKKSIKNR